MKTPPINGSTREIATHDVAIVGGSTAGCHLAWLLARQGIEVILLEEHSVMGLPVQCAGIVSSKVLQLLPVPREAILNQVHAAAIHAPGGGVSISSKDHPLVLDRAVLDAHLASLAIAAGASVLTGVKVTDIDTNDDVAVLSTKDGARFKARLVAGCDGPRSTVAKCMGIRSELLVGKQVELSPVPGRSPPPGILPMPADDTCELHFDPRWPDLFAWVIPLGEGAWRVGLASRTKTAAAFDRFLKQRFGDALANGGLEVQNVSGGLIPCGIMKPCAFNKVILVGDAACQVKATTGGGIVMLSIASKYAAKAIARSLAKRDGSRRFLTRQYQRPCKRVIGVHLKLHFVIHSALKSMTAQDFSFLTSLGKDPSIQAGLRHMADMDFPARFIVSLLSRPAFVAWVVRFFVRNSQLVFLALRTFLHGKQ